MTIAGEVGIGFSETSEGRDALLAFGANESSGGVLVSSSSNDFTGLVDDLEFTITGTSTTPVTVSVSQSDDKITSQIEALVTQYNKVRDKFQEVTRFDEATQSVGILFGKSIAIRIDQSFGRLFSGSFRGAGEIGSLGQLGIRLNESGKLEFDKAKFDEAYQADPAAVEEFFTAEDTGFSAKARSVADSLAGVGSGALLGRTDTLAQQIEQNAKRITAMNVRLDKQRTRLLNQLYNMETAIAKLQQNLTAVNQLQIIPPLGSSSSS